MVFKVLTGPACMFKTSLLKNKLKEGVPVVVGDYNDHCDKFPIFKSKYEIRRHVDLEYQLFVLSRMKDNHIHDRWMIDNLLYTQIWDVIKKKVTLRVALQTITSTTDG
ncbi:hypothetical protein M8J76_010185 [Diaphorina citri]|nr:hypothetical protein M8J77_005227 [Diaphorina citri]KAI5709103.1 hypothetical protein M8J76_010185 [Diaphorina citri]